MLVPHHRGSESPRAFFPAPEAAAFVVVLVCTVVRPLFDLFGYYSGTGLTPGGAIAILYLCAASLLFISSAVELAGLRVIFLSLLLLYLVSIMANGALPASELPLARFCVGFSALVLLGLPRRLHRHLLPMARIYLVVILVPITLAWLQHFGMVPFSYYDDLSIGRVGRPSGGYFAPSSLTRLLIFGIILIYLVDARSRVRLPVKYAYLALILGTVFLSGHRTSLVVALVCVALLEARDVVTTMKKLPYAVGLAALISVLSTIFGSALTKYAEIYEQILAIGSSDFNFRGRFQIWGEVQHELSHNDTVRWLIGNGFPALEAHNDALNILLTVGVIGLCGYILLLGRAYLIVRRRADSTGKRVLFTSSVAYLLFAIGLQPSEYTHFIWMFFFTLACAMYLGPAVDERLPASRSSTGVDPAHPRAQARQTSNVNV